MIKAVFFDIDGTLVPFKQKIIHPSALEALHALKERGIKTFLATGRALTTLGFAYEQFDFDGYLAMNGQYCVYHDEVVRASVLDVDQIKAIIPYIHENDMSVAFVEKDYLYINAMSRFYKQMLKEYPRHQPIEDLDRLDHHKTYQLIMYITPAEEERFFKHFPYFKPVRWNPRFSDVIAKDGGKEVGIDAICQRLGITNDQCMAFGDGGNDIGMIQHAGIGVAMGNATDDVKEAADYVTSRDIDDGIWNALKHFEVI